MRPIARAAASTVLAAALLIAGVAAVAHTASTWFLTGALVPSPSMEPTLRVGDRLVFSPALTAARGVQRGDIVVFFDPGGWVGSPAMQRLRAAQLTGQPDAQFTGVGLVKRVIAIEGDRVQCCTPTGQLLINNEVEDTPQAVGSSNQGAFDVLVEPGTVFVAGDNREESSDSRTRAARGAPQATVATELIRGKAWAVAYPLRRARILN